MLPNPLESWKLILKNEDEQFAEFFSGWLIESLLPRAYQQTLQPAESK